ncbi:(4Fe-4S)-binding protein [Chitinophaga flava]|uniref:Iron-binding zinc finger CDGSH type domain-containing protein n=1 Tax=Chitinophaga flava TaxID=2259036 RepID=A0A365XWS2_9BACT|nr:(4Fe-4S)-binding protein [Chitinophaga flava]RBL90793.1 hypothetical protein DF182_30610 [Chitinophaga flava]
MKDITKTYSNGEVTIVWKPEVCKHSEVCFRGLPEVFDPHAKPWINATGSNTERIIQQVNKCPSGALTYFMNNEVLANGSSPEITASSLAEIVPNGPRLIYGSIHTKDTSGHETQEYKVTAFCRCGSSSNMPYCDGTHIKTGFTDNE